MKRKPNSARTACRTTATLPTSNHPAFQVNLLAALTSKRLRSLLAIGLMVLLFSTSLSTQVRSVKAQQTAAGKLDATFGNGGKVTTQIFGFQDVTFAVAVQPDGMIVAAGNTEKQNGNQDSDDFALVRYTTGGNLDTTFGTGGKVTTDFFGFEDGALAVVLQPDGKIVAAGFAAKQSADQGSNDFALARYNPDGSLDTTFGNGGKVTTDFFGSDDSAQAMALQPNGQIVLAGFAETAARTNIEFAVGRYNADGSLDTAFGSGGKVTTAFSEFSDFALAVALQPDGKIVAAGNTQPQASDGASVVFAVARYNTNGTLDATFGTGGKVTTAFFGFGDKASAVAVQPDGMIVAAGFSETSTGFDLAVARYNTNGSLDATFGDGGKVTTAFFGTGGQANAIALQPDAKIVAAGYAVPQNGIGSVFALARYNTNGSLDTTFGTGGTVTTNFFGNDKAFAVALPPDGTIVVTGYTQTENASFEIAVARYLAGAVPGDFSVAATPASQAVSAGQSTSYTINLQAPAATEAVGVNPEATSVTLSADVSPATSDITTTFTAASVELPGSSTLNVTTTKATPVGTYTITITSTAGVLTQATNVTLIVSGPDFSLSFAQPTVTAEPGTKATVVLNINRLDGLKGSVSITPPSAPTGIKVKPASVISTTGASATFKLKIAASVAAASYQLTFTGKDKSGTTHSATVTLVVQ
jgi:uncharacterized delta-60 repeat protein